MMRLSGVLSSAAFLHVTSGFECNASAASGLLPKNARIVLAQQLADNSTFHVPASDIAFPTSPSGLPSLCALQVGVGEGNSSYNFGLFLPDDWNGRYLAVGNGGFAGGISWDGMGPGVQYGFATMSTDTGHNSTASDGTWAYNNEAGIIDWAYAALHNSITLSKAITNSYYASEISYSYYSGCSTGGRQGLIEAEMFPDDFDGIVAGSPAWWTEHLQPWSLWLGIINAPNNSYHIPSELFNVIGAEVLRQCDGQDGVLDSIISDPARCNFRIESLLCGGNGTDGIVNASACLTGNQIETVYKVYNDWSTAEQELIFPRLMLGSEAQWEFLLGGDEPTTLGTDYVKYFLGLGPSWRWQDFNYSIITLADQTDPGNATANDFDLSPFKEKGGKLLMYHGLSDAEIATGSSLYFYNQVLKTLQPKGVNLDDFYRFFLVPGMQHCTGTPSNMNAPWYFAGAGQPGALNTHVHSVPGFSDAKHDVLLAIMAWVENGTAPTQIIATKWNNDTLQDEVYRQRPLCMYPKQAKLKGDDVDAAESWQCELLY